MTVETPAGREPIFHVPGVVLAFVAAIGLVHAARALLLSDEADRLFLLTFAFIPARYEASVLPDGILPGGTGADIWSFVTYALIHADLMHLGFNAVWLLAFGSPVARRFGAARFLALSIAATAAGALAHLIFHKGDLAPVVGASAAISGMMGAATRFVFQRGGPLDRWRPGGPSGADRIPAAPLTVALRNPQVIAFLAVWFGVNLVFGIGSISLAGEEQAIAWEAHVGGFLVGLLLFALFDPAVAPADPPQLPPPPDADAR